MTDNGDLHRCERISHYKLEGVAARGGQSVVYRATDETLGRVVALKVIDDPAAAEHLIEEARVTCRLDHPGIASVYQAGIDEELGCAFIAFEWVDGVPLRAKLRSGTLDRTEFLRYAEQVADAVAYAHQSNFVHGDLKADNVIVTHGDARLKLIDFGLSSAIEAGVKGTELWGTPAYMAPELFEGAPRSTASDLFALGVLLYELASGHLPFGGHDGDEAQVRSNQTQDPTEVRSLNPELSAAGGEIIHSLLLSDPDRRGPTASEVSRWARLEQRRSSPLRRLLTATTLLVLVAGGLGYGFRDRWWPEPVAVLPDAPQTYRLALGRWLALDSVEADLDSVLGARLLAMFADGDDPGSAVLGSTVLHPSTESIAGAGGAVAVLEGEWGRGPDGWVAVFRLRGDGLPDRRERVVAPDPVTLATRVLDKLSEVGAGANIPVSIATTLTPSVESLQLFVKGVEQADQLDLSSAAASFRRARETAGTFPEAQAWEIAVEIVRGNFDQVADRVTLLRDKPSLLARLLVRRFGVPCLGRSDRWRQLHRFARRLDLVLDSYDAATPDQVLLTGLARDSTSLSHELLRLRTTLAIRHGQAEVARDGLERYQVSPGAAPWRSRLLSWQFEQRQASERARIGALAEWLLGLGDQESSFLRLPYFVAKHKLGTAVSLAGEMDPVSVDGRLTRALVLAIGGEVEAAAAIANTLDHPYDLGLGQRIVAAVQILAGDTDGATGALSRARELDPSHVRTAHLARYVAAADLYAYRTEPTEPSAETRFQLDFDALGRARESRLAGNAEAARRELGGIRWVDSELRMLEWPELGFLAWLERIACACHEKDRDRARSELEAFRQWWPDDRAPSSRISREAAAIRALVDGLGSD